MRTKLLFPVLVAVLAGLAGCAGARPGVKFDTSRYPVSLSSTVIDRNGRFLAPEARTTVGRFSSSKTGFAVGYSHADMNKVDFSDEVNKQVAVVNGDAVVNLEVATTDSCMCFNMMWITQALPIFPGCVKVLVEGDIIQARSSARGGQAEKDRAGRAVAEEPHAPEAGKGRMTRDTFRTVTNGSSIPARIFLRPLSSSCRPPF